MAITGNEGDAHTYSLGTAVGGRFSGFVKLFILPELEN